MLFLIAGTIAGYQLGNLTRENATTYMATFTVTEGGIDIVAGSNISVANVVLRDTAGNSTIELWTSAEITKALWLDANDASTITQSDGLVSQWNDKSGNARNLTQGTRDSRPITGTRSVIGLNEIEFV